ncbi:hypothetical protein FHS19_005068 [Paenibacillus rhizosphaerae]|uniref:Uncharacterized protein n=1 Tax=Paenibacillus rhizosphaerae TaxID=297318 RepID=A0A839TV55_9BACL|nr:hypothetical protein [Paenibacillus rhizosphaerae]
MFDMTTGPDRSAAGNDDLRAAACEKVEWRMT